MSPELVEAVARRVAELVELPAEGWLNTERAAEYLSAPTSRVHDLVSAGHLHPHRDGTRLMFRREDLDAALEGPE